MQPRHFYSKQILPAKARGLHKPVSVFRRKADSTYDI